MKLANVPTGVVNLAALRPAAQRLGPGAEGEVEHPIGLAPGAEGEVEHPVNVAPGAYQRGQVHPMWMAPVATALNAQLGGIIDTIKGTFEKLRYKPEELAQRQVAEAVQLMQADAAARQQ